MGKSHRHHYLPVVYLKGFTNADGKFAIWDKKNQKMKRGLFTPNSHFFIPDRNTTIKGGVPDDFIEKLYGFSENMIAGILSRVREANSLKVLELWEIMTLQLFLVQLFWRTPNLDTVYPAFYKTINPNDFGLQIIDKASGKPIPKEDAEQIYQDEEFMRAFRTLTPILNYTFLELEKDIDNWSAYFHNKPSFGLCGDNPFIFQDENSKFLFNKGIVVPLANNALIVRKDGSKSAAISGETKVLIDAIILKQSEYYVCSACPEYLNDIAFWVKDKNIVDLKNMLFDSIK